MAAPHVAGVIALGLSVNPEMDRQKLLECLYNTAKNISDINTEEMGRGLVDAKAFVECCDVDAFLPETEKVAAYGAYADCAPPLEFVLRAGDALFIPQFWFHAVRSLDVSISVNAFFSTARDMVRRAPRRALAEFAHNRLGFWRGNCVCHGRRRDNER